MRLKVKVEDINVERGGVSRWYSHSRCNGSGGCFSRAWWAGASCCRSPSITMDAGDASSFTLCSLLPVMVCMCCCCSVMWMLFFSNAVPFRGRDLWALFLLRIANRMRVVMLGWAFHVPTAGIGRYCVTVGGRIAKLGLALLFFVFSGERNWR